MRSISENLISSSLSLAKKIGGKQVSPKRVKRRTLQYEVLENRAMLSVSAGFVGSGDAVVFTSNTSSDAFVFSVDVNGNLQHNKGGVDGFDSSIDLDTSNAGTQSRLVTELDNLSYIDSSNSDSVSFDGHFVFSDSAFTELSVVAKNIVMGNGSKIEIPDGDLGFRANTDGTATGNFIGIRLDNAEVVSTRGSVYMEGHGGDQSSTASHHGIQIANGSRIISDGNDKSTAATITLAGFGGVGDNNSYGFYLDGSATEIRSISGDITIEGTGGSGDRMNYGVRFLNGPSVMSQGLVKSNSARIQLDGTGGSGTKLAEGLRFEGTGSKVTTVAGDIQIRGQGGSTVHGRSSGIHVIRGALIESLGTEKEHAGFILMDGVGGIDGAHSSGVVVSGTGSTVRSFSGDIELNGIGGNGDGGWYKGVKIVNGGVVESIGDTKAEAASINVIGTAGTGTTESSTHLTGVLIGQAGDAAEAIGQGENARISSVSGDITIIGTGGTGPGNAHSGVKLDSGLVESTGLTKSNAAIINISGIGGTSTLELAWGLNGVIMYDSRIISVAGAIELHGTGGVNGRLSHGVYATGTDSTVRSFSGDIQLNGTGGIGGHGNSGVDFNTGATIESTGISKENAANIMINGKGGSAPIVEAHNLIGVRMRGSRVSVAAGDIFIDGVGGHGQGQLGNFSYGVALNGVSLIESTGATKQDAGNITIKGQGGGNTFGGNGGFGIGQDAQILSVAGDIDIEGHGGDGSGFWNFGIILISGGKIQTSGDSYENAGNISLRGTGGIGTHENFGVWITGELGGTGTPYGETVVSTTYGQIEIIGTGGEETGTQNTGIEIRQNSTIGSLAGDLLLDGTGGLGDSHGIHLYANSLVATQAGNIDVIGLGSGSAPSIEATGLHSDSGIVVLTAPTGIITEAELGVDISGGDVIFNGEVAPAGQSNTGALVVMGDLFLDSSDTFSVEINGPIAINEYDQLQVLSFDSPAGSIVDLGDSALNVSLGFEPNIGDEFIILNILDANSIISGTFASLPEGAGLTVGTSFFVITYQGGQDQNDVVLTAVEYLPPDIANQSFAVNENAPNSSSVGFIDAVDPSGNGLTYSIIGGDGSLVFSVDSATGEILVTDSVQLDYETVQQFTLEVEVEDSLGQSDSATVFIDLLNLASIMGVVFVDVNNDGEMQANEPGINGVVIELLDTSGSPVLDENNLPITAETSDGGFYLFEDLSPETYQIHEVQPTGVGDGTEILGSAGGEIVANDTMQLTLARDDVFDYAFAELGQELVSGDTATIGFWQNKHGQALISQGGTELASWLTENFGNVFGDTFANDATGEEVAEFYKFQLFKQKAKKSPGPAKVDAQFMATALATFFTSSNLAGHIATGYGFNVTDTGIGANIVNVGDNGLAFGVADESELTMMQLLLATNNLTDQPDNQSGSASVYDINGDGEIDAYEESLRVKANFVYSWINESGDI